MARKLNKKLVAGVVLTAALAGGAVVVGPRLLRPSIAKLVAAGDAAVAAQDWETATIVYGKAATRAKTDVDLQLKFVDALEYTVQGNAEKYKQLRLTQAQILTNDPRSVPALRHVLANQRVMVQEQPADNGAVRALAGTAERLEQLVPGDREARMAAVSAVYEPYVRNLEVKPEDVDTQRASADELLAEKPDDADALKMVLQFRITAVQRLLQQNDPAGAKEQMTAAIAIADDATKNTPQTAGAWMCRFTTYYTAVNLLAGQDKAKREAMGKTLEASLAKADELAKPGDAMFLQIRTTALRILELRDAKAAEARYRQLLTELPDDRGPRIMLAEFLARQPARRDDAVAVLETPWKPTKPLKAIDSLYQHYNALIEKVRGAMIRLGALDTVTDAADREERLKVIDGSYKDLLSDPDTGTRFKAALMRIDGGLQLQRGQTVEAIGTLDAALKLMNPDSPASVDQDVRNDTLMEYARANLRLGQTRPARDALAELVQRKPENLNARAMLADVLINERDFDAASQQVDQLTRLVGDSPYVQRMRVRLLAQRSDKLKAEYPKMAEATKSQRQVKLTAAATLSDAGEVIRLAKLMVDADPADADAATVLAQAYAQTDRRDEAVAVVAAGLKASPDDAKLKSMRESLAATTAEQRTELVGRRVEEITDPYARALARAELARQQGKTDDAIAALKEAEGIGHDDPRAFDAHFGLAISAKRWPEAEALLADLTRTNADQADGALARIRLAAARATLDPDPAKRDAAVKAVVAQAQSAAQKYRDLAAASLVYGQLLQQTGDFNAAVDQYGQTLDKSPANLDALVGISDSLLHTDRRAEARTRIDAAKAVAPDDARVRELDLSYDLKFGDPARAVQTLQAQVDQRPDDVQAAVRLGLALEQVAEAKGKAGDAKAAGELITRASAVYAAGIQKFPKQLSFVSAYADAQRKLGNPQAAETAAEKLAADPQYQDRPEIVEFLAEQYVRSGKNDDAVRVLAGVVDRTKPAPVSTVRRLAVLLAQQNRGNEALSILNLRADDAGVQRQRVQMLLDGNDLAGARQAIDGLLATDATADTYLLAAYVELRGRDFTKAEGFLNKVFETRPDDAAALFYRGQVRLNKRPADPDGGRDDLIRARDLQPGNVDIRLMLADAFTLRRDPGSALNELQQAWSGNRQSKPALRRLVDAYAKASPPMWAAVTKVMDEARADPALAGDPDVILLEGETAVARGDTAAARTAATKLLAVAPKDAGMRQRCLDLLLRAKAYRDVIDVSQPMLADSGDAWWLYRVRGVAYAGLGQKADAQKATDGAFNLAIAANDGSAVQQVARSIARTQGVAAAVEKVTPVAATNPGLRSIVGTLYFEGGDLAAAQKALEPVNADRAGLAPPVVRQTLQMLGACYLQASPPQADKARAVFEELLKQTPDDVLTLNNLSCVLLLPGSGGTPAQALDYAKRAYDQINTGEVGDLSLTIWDTYGWALVQNKRVDDGIEVLRRSAETAQFPDVFLHLAEAYLTSNNVDSAETSLGDARRQIESRERRKQPIDPAVKAKLDQLTADLEKRKPAAPTG